MTTLRRPIAQQLLNHLGAFIWQMDVNPGKPRPPSASEIAHARNVELTKLDHHTQRDLGMSAQDATGISSYHEALPFFMQAGFR